jgi:hypothetical protein
MDPAVAQTSTSAKDPPSEIAAVLRTFAVLRVATARPGVRRHSGAARTLRCLQMAHVAVQTSINAKTPAMEIVVRPQTTVVGQQAIVLQDAKAPLEHAPPRTYHRMELAEVRKGMCARAHLLVNVAAALATVAPPAVIATLATRARLALVPRRTNRLMVPAVAPRAIRVREQATAIVAVRVGIVGRALIIAVLGVKENLDSARQ